MHSDSLNLRSLQSSTVRLCNKQLCGLHRSISRQPGIWSRSARAKAPAGSMLDLFSANQTSSSMARQSGKCCSLGQGQQASPWQPQVITGGAGATAAAAAAGAAGAVVINHSAAPDAHSNPYTSWRTLRQCMLLAIAALGAAPALLLLDIAEQAVLGMGRVRQHVSLWHDAQQQHHQGGEQHPQQQQQQQQWWQAVQHKQHVRPLLPVWPPMAPMILAVAPLGLLIPPVHRSACAQPALLLGASLVLQGYLNLLLTSWARVRGSPITAASPAWAATAAAAAAAGTQQAAQGIDSIHVLPAKGPRHGMVAMTMFACLQLAGDWLRLACCGCMAWLAAHATAAAQAAGQAGPTSILWGALQQCVHAADLSHVVAAATVAAAALLQLLQVWLGSVCIVAVCCGSAAVYGLSLFSRCKRGK